ncbi:XK-related protein 6-like [Tropilaelaps mercedesae]|uniref:XK-related protein n=1 Tax=Tropilaelaps mercedesae TaxID=418985 RepID=A0A1V9XV00_9ACAR|nr:XK-related protein 6-like [Tropilaelaps mercedesae]
MKKYCSSTEVLKTGRYRFSRPAADLPQGKAMNDAELLPICDILFVISSLLIYFCDVLFSFLLAYALFLQDLLLWPCILLALILLSSVLCQGFSFKWHVRSRRQYLRDNPSPDPEPLWLTHTIVFVHCLQLGVLWRYLRLFIPVELGSVKEQVRDLCMLRMLHAFVQSTPVLLIELQLLFSKPLEDITDLDRVAASLALVSVCWALASFGKNVRRRNMDRLVLTWLGIVCQFFWRLGTVSARVTALSLYAALYGHWVLLLLLLHWLTVFLWLLAPNNLFKDEDTPASTRLWRCGVVACVYTLDYINLQQNASKLKLVAFYAVMLLENLLLVLLWCVVYKDTKVIWFESHAILVVWAGFLLGIMFMLLYYRCFHINVLKQIYGESTTELPRSHSDAVAKLSKTTAPETNGVFNCVLNRGISRKKKKPSTFVPPPNVSFQPGVKMSQPFWKRLSLSRISDCDSMSMSAEHIKSKLEQKHRKQLLELQNIQEEIRSGRIDALGISTPMPPQLRVEPPLIKGSPMWRGKIMSDINYNGYHPALLVQQRIDFLPRYTIVEPTPVHNPGRQTATGATAACHHTSPYGAAESMDGDNDTSDTERIPPDALYRDQLGGGGGSRSRTRQSRGRIRLSQHLTPRTQL